MRFRRRVGGLLLTGLLTTAPSLVGHPLAAVDSAAMELAQSGLVSKDPLDDGYNAWKGGRYNEAITFLRPLADAGVSVANYYMWKPSVPNAKMVFTRSKRTGSL